MTANSTSTEIALLRKRLAEVEQERLTLVHRIDELEAGQKAAAAAPPVTAPQPAATPTVTNSSSAADKIALFRRLFSGRTDVFPARWENPKSDKSGYAPACANEWVRGVCGKPQVKCGECPNQKFIPVTANVIECHLRGEDRVRPNGRGGPFVSGVYEIEFGRPASERSATS